MNAGSSHTRLDVRIYLLALGTFALGTDAFVIAGIMPMIARDLGVSVEAAGQVVTVYALTYARARPFSPHSPRNGGASG